MKLRLQNLERIYKQFIMLLVDVITILLALWFAIALINDVLPVPGGP